MFFSNTTTDVAPQWEKTVSATTLRDTPLSSGQDLVNFFTLLCNIALRYKRTTSGAPKRYSDKAATEFVTSALEQPIPQNLPWYFKNRPPILKVSRAAIGVTAYEQKNFPKKFSNGARQKFAGDASNLEPFVLCSGFERLHGHARPSSRKTRYVVLVCWGELRRGPRRLLLYNL